MALWSQHQLDSMPSLLATSPNPPLPSSQRPLTGPHHHAENQSATSSTPCSPVLGEPVAQAILQLDTRVLVAAVLEAQHQFIKLLVNILRFEALLECPIVGRNGRYVSIANARRHLQYLFAKVLKIDVVVAQRLIDPPRIFIAFASNNVESAPRVTERLSLRS